MSGFHQALFLFLTSLVFGAFSLLEWWRNKKSEKPSSQRDWNWRNWDWRTRDWLTLGFFMGYGCAILVYWLSSLLTEPVTDLTSHVIQVLTDIAAGEPADP